MGELTGKERELVAIGAALGSNCAPCIEYHVPEARRAGLTDAQIEDAIRLADKVRQVPAQKALAAAMTMLTAERPEPQPTPAGSGCGQPVATSSRGQAAASSGREQPCCA